MSVPLVRGRQPVTNHDCQYGIDSLVTAMGMIMNRSIYKNCNMIRQFHAVDGSDPSCFANFTWKSPSDDANEYNKVIVVNCMSE